jgi:hypothetical protein
VVRRAVRLCRAFAVPHALAAFDRMGASDAVVGARAVLKWTGRRPDPVADFSKRDAFNGCRGTFGMVDDLQPALDLLERHYLNRPKPDRESRGGPGRKPSPVCEVNPRATDLLTAAHNPHNPRNGGRRPADPNTA